MSKLEDNWYWDYRNNKAYRPVETDGDTVTFVTVWHEEEVEDARAGEALVPIDELDMGPIDSFRLPEDPLGEEDG